MKTDTTQEEVKRMLEGGMRQLSPRQLIEEINACGYELEADLCFSYTNTSNPISYKARSLSYRHTESRKGFAQIDAPRDTLPQLQQIRRECFVFHRGRIWEL